VCIDKRDFYSEMVRRIEQECRAVQGEANPCLKKLLQVLEDNVSII
jgi:hypothetical protein